MVKLGNFFAYGDGYDKVIVFDRKTIDHSPDDWKDSLSESPGFEIIGTIEQFDNLH